MNRIKFRELYKELNNIADDMYLTDDDRNRFVIQVIDYVIDCDITHWNGVYGYIDGLFTNFDEDDTSTI